MKLGNANTENVLMLLLKYSTQEQIDLTEQFRLIVKFSISKSFCVVVIFIICCAREVLRSSWILNECNLSCKIILWKTERVKRREKCVKKHYKQLIDVHLTERDLVIAKRRTEWVFLSAFFLTIEFVYLLIAAAPRYRCSKRLPVVYHNQRGAWFFHFIAHLNNNARHAWEVIA